MAVSKLMFGRIVKSAVQKLVPDSIQEFVRSSRRKATPAYREMLSLLAANRALNRRHAGKRCFIIGTGPSINTMDLAPLKDELCIGLNGFYLHELSADIAPHYYLTSGVSTHPLITEDAGHNWFREMEERTAGSTLLLQYVDRPFVHQHHLFEGRQTHYFHWEVPWGSRQAEIDATQPLFQFTNVAVMALQIALYMGFSEIFLLGLDHDWILRQADRLPTSFFRPEMDAVGRAGLTHWDTFNNWGITLRTYCNLWAEYEAVRSYADQRGVKIFNATNGGMLDVFPRVEFSGLFARESPAGVTGQL